MERNPIHEVLCTPELIALILIHLSPHDLLLNAPLVSPTFHLTVQTTPSLQESLFFRLSHLPKPVTINPFLATAFPTHFSPSNGYVGSPEIRKLPWAQNAKAFKRREASWRKMLLWNGGDPEKIKRVKITGTIQQMTSIYALNGYLSSDLGVRMGAVWDQTRGVCETYEKGQFRLKWHYSICSDMGNIQLDRAITHGRHRRSFFGRLRSVIRDRQQRIPLQTRFVELGNRIEEEEQEWEVMEIHLSTSMSRERRGIFAPSPKGLGEEFVSDGFERVVIEYQQIEIPDLFGRSAAAFRAQRSRRRGLFA